MTSATPPSLVASTAQDLLALPVADRVPLQVKMQDAINDAAAYAVANRAGWRTSEFWLSILVVVGGAAAAIWSHNQVAQAAGMLASALSVIGYGNSRATVKKGS